MLTRFNDVYDFEKEFQAIVAQDVKYDGDKTEVKVFIPALMPNIMQGAAGYSRVNNRGCKQVFANVKGTEPQIHDNYIEEKNYLIARIDPNSNIDVISLISSDTLIKEFKLDFNIFDGNFYDPQYETAYDEYKKSLRDIPYSYSSSPDALDEYEEEENDSTDLHMKNTTYGISETDMEYDEDEENIEKENFDCLFSTSNTEKLSFQLIDIEDESTIYDSKVVSSNSRFCLYNTNDELIYKSSSTRNGMYYDEAYEDKNYLIKKGSNVRCNFLNAKASKLYLKSGPKKD